MLAYVLSAQSTVKPVKAVCLILGSSVCLQSPKEGGPVFLNPD